MNVTEEEIISAIKAGAKSLKDIQKMTSASTGNLCEELNPKGVCCANDIIDLLPKQKCSCSCCCG
jgi:NAD(P)H-nitrite reductase large subunit